MAEKKEKKPKCLSFNKPITNDRGSVQFDCPSCGKYKIVRSSQARKTVAKYKCPNCGFEGPN